MVVVRRIRHIRARVRSRALSARLVRRGRARLKHRQAGRSGVRTLVFANPYARSESAPEIAAFLDNVERLAEGRLHVELVSGWTSPRERDSERTVLEDVARGIADLGWAGARSVGAAFGIRSLDPLHAPLLFPNEEAVHRYLAVAELDPLLAPLRRVGIVGLTLLPGGMRLPFGITTPLVRPEDWIGKIIRTHGSLPAIAAFRALGATPVLRAPAEKGGRSAVGIDGMDLHLRAVAAWGYAGWLTWNVPLWPRIVLVAGNARRLESLSSDERAVLDEAARLATTQTVQRVPTESPEQLPDSVRLVEASEDDISLLRERLRPVNDELRSTSEGEQTLADVERFLALPNDPT
jgi:TRAP-type C4-dicarboxylate transport system substrate-binding protein